ncbi:MAG: LPS translocon maturation chaperone LptM [Halioglobus sp.]
MLRLVTAIVFSTVLAALVGCGQMGPLYMPPPEEAGGTQAESTPTSSQLSQQKPGNR